MACTAQHDGTASMWQCCREMPRANAAMTTHPLLLQEVVQEVAVRQLELLHIVGSACNRGATSA